MSSIPVLAFPEESGLPPLRTPTHPVVRYVKVLSRTTLLVTLLILGVAKFIIQPAMETTLERRFVLQNFAYVQLKKLSKRLKQTIQNPPSINVTYNNKILVDRTLCTDDIMVEETRENEYEYFKKDSKRKSYNVKFSIEGDNGIENEVKFANDDNNSSFTTYTELNDKLNYSTTKLTTSLGKLRDRMKEFNVPEFRQLSTSNGFGTGDPEMNSLLYQIKQFKTYLEVVTSEHPREMLFKKPLSHIQIGKNKGNSYKFNYLDILNNNIDDMKQIIDS